jgi:hypothetical protein
MRLAQLLLWDEDRIERADHLLAEYPPVPFEEIPEDLPGGVDLILRAVSHLRHLRALQRCRPIVDERDEDAINVYDDTGVVNFVYWVDSFHWCRRIEFHAVREDVEFAATVMVEALMLVRTWSARMPELRMIGMMTVSWDSTTAIRFLIRDTVPHAVLPLRVGPGFDLQKAVVAAARVLAAIKQRAPELVDGVSIGIDREYLSGDEGDTPGSDDAR